MQIWCKFNDMSFGVGILSSTSFKKKKKFLVRVLQSMGVLWLDAQMEQLFGLGVANVLGSAFSSYPTTGK
jgi:FixJ family two-component response regulator